MMAMTTAGATDGPEDLRSLYDEAPCGYLSALADGTIVAANQTFHTLAGYPATESLSGRRFPSLLTAPSALLFETYCLPLLRLQGYLNEVALDLLSSEGRPLPVLLCATAKRDASGAVERYRIAILNAPRRREYERELLRARTEAEDAAQELRRLREQAERKVAEQARLLSAVGRMAAGDLGTPIGTDDGSALFELASGLERLRRDILLQIQALTERNTEIQTLNRELRHQIEQRSMLLADSMASRGDLETAEILPLLPAGTVLSARYRIAAILGQGGMATVYEVERISDGRRFAAKVLGVKPNSHALARFAREAQLLSRLQHPSLIDIIDTDVTEDRVAYIVMELLRGRSLAEHADRYGELAFVLPVLSQIVGALVAVHEAEIVHRDLKPSNVLISIGEDGSLLVKLVDFGISRLLDPAPQATPTPPRIDVSALTLPGAAASSADTFDAVTTEAPRGVVQALSPTLLRESAYQPTPLPVVAASPARPHTPADDGVRPRRGRSSDQLTQFGALLGTPSYIAPELATGSHLAQPASDIFSFGVLAYEVLTGRLPFAAPPLLEVIRGNGRLSFAPLAGLCRGLASEVVASLERCLSVDPAQRPTAAELWQVFEAQKLAPNDSRIR